MFQKVLPFLMTMMLLANQAIAVVSHSHGESSDPTARPHVHLHCNCCSHGHHHHHHGHSHEHESDRDNEAIANSEAASHDIDAIYAGEAVSVFAQKTTTTPLDLSIVGEPVLVLCESPIPARTKYIARPESSSRFAHARMLKTVRLLI